MTLRSTLFGLTFLTTLALPVATAAQPQYSFTDFDGPVATGATIDSTFINGISNSGVVVGFTVDKSGGFVNFKGVPGSFTSLNIPSDANPNGINVSGQVVGSITTSAFLLESSVPGSSPQTLPLVTPTTDNEVAFGINDGGSIVGQYSESTTGIMLGFLDVGKVFTTLNPVASTDSSPIVFAQGVNNAGLVVGYYSEADGIDHGFLYDSLSKSYSLLADPVTAQTANGNLSLTQFLGINDSGVAVGYYQANDTGSQFGFLYDTKTKTYTYLDNPSAVPDSAGTQTTQITGITNFGKIAGYYVNTAGVQQGFIAAPVPEASSALGLGLLLTMGGAALALRASRRRVGQAV